MKEALIPLIEFVEQIGHKSGKASSLTHPKFVLWKEVETLLDIKQLRVGLIFNMRAKSFFPLTITYPTKNKSKNKTAPEKPLQKYQQNIETSADNNLKRQVQ